jgi:CheY-like chemotaxis protein
MFRSESNSVRALVVDDDPGIRRTVSLLLESVGCNVQTAADGEQALIQALEFQAEIVFLDINLPLQRGWLVCAKLKLVDPSPSVVLMTGLACDELSSFSEFVKADAVLRKPFSEQDLLGLLPKSPTLRAANNLHRSAS